MEEIMHPRNIRLVNGNTKVVIVHHISYPVIKCALLSWMKTRKVHTGNGKWKHSFSDMKISDNYHLAFRIHLDLIILLFRADLSYHDFAN